MAAVVDVVAVVAAAVIDVVTPEISPKQRDDYFGCAVATNAADKAAAKAGSASAASFEDDAVWPLPLAAAAAAAAARVHADAVPIFPERLESVESFATEDCSRYGWPKPDHLPISNSKASMAPRD